MATPRTPEAQGRHGVKSPAAFRTIAEVADELDLPQHVLRFWETKFPQVKPLKRRGGRRYYRPEDVRLLRSIRRLLYVEGYTIRGVQRLLQEHGIKLDVTALPATAAAPSRPEPEAGQAPPSAAAPGGDGSPLSDNEERRKAIEDVIARLEAIRDLLRQ
jgi:DNA-binding transcriptional MerR regulator